MARKGLLELASVGIAVASLALGGSALAGEAPMATHPGSKAVEAGNVDFRAAGIEARVVSLGVPGELLEKGGAAKAEQPENRVGISRKAEVAAMEPMAREAAWSRVAGGYAAKFVVRSGQAKRLRVELRITAIVASLEIRVASSDSARPELLSNQWLRETFGEAPGTVWTPSTAGDTQVVEVFVAGESLPEGLGVSVSNVSHLFVDPFDPSGAPLSSNPKLLTCHQNYSCVTDANIVSSGRAVARMIVTRANGDSVYCSGSLLNDTANVRRYFATAYHCVATSGEAGSVQFGWFYEQSCGGTTLSPASTTAQGSQLLRADKQNDFALLQVTGSIPSGTILLGWTASALASGTSVYGVHHPAGVPKAYSIGTAGGRNTSSALLSNGDVLTVNGNKVGWQTGIVEPGSSGSPLMSGEGVVRGTLSMVPRNLSCGGTPEAYYSDFSLAYPLVRQWLNPAVVVVDDFPNTAAEASGTTAFDNAFLKVQLDSPTDQDWIKFTFAQAGVWIVYATNESGSPGVDNVGRIFRSDGTTLLQENDDDELGIQGSNFAFYLSVNVPGTYYLQVTGRNGATGRFELVSLYDANDDHSDLSFLGTALAAGREIAGRIESPGDGDYFVFDQAARGTVTFTSRGSTDVVGVLRDSSLGVIALNDDVSAGDTNFRITADLVAGRYYLQVVGYDVAVTGNYSVAASGSSSSALNLSDIWATIGENGWGVQVNHQGDILFASIYTYEANGAQVWLVMSAGRKQADGSYLGEILRMTGPPFQTNPWGAVSQAPVGTARFTPRSDGTLQLQYTYNGAGVNKILSRYGYSTPATCTFTTASRANSTNVQDLWYTRGEVGWGVALSQQGTTVFGSIFTYDQSGQPAWFVMSSGVRTGTSPLTFRGDLFATTGPAFNSSPWPNTAAATPIGTMTLTFSQGDEGTVSYTAYGVTVTKPIERFVFASPVTTCQ